jgi:hypothetical protein
MARLGTWGFDLRQLSASFQRSDSEGGQSAGTAGVIDTANARLGLGACLKTQANSTTRAYQWTAGAVNDRTYYFREYVYLSALPSVDNTIIQGYNTAFSTPTFQIRVKTNGTVEVRNGAFTLIGTSTTALTAGAWHRIEVRVRIATGGNDQIELRINGGAAEVLNNNVAIAAVAQGGWRVGCTSDASNIDIYHDDVAVNDDQGADQNSWCGDGKVILLPAGSVTSRGANWFGGSGGTTNLHEAVNNIPPTGKNTAGSTDADQVENAVNSAGAAADRFDIETVTYASMLNSADTVTLVQALAQGGSAASARTMRLEALSNPVLAQVTHATVEALSTSPAG